MAAPAAASASASTSAALPLIAASTKTCQNNLKRGSQFSSAVAEAAKNSAASYRRRTSTAMVDLADSTPTRASTQGISRPREFKRVTHVQFNASEARFVNVPPGMEKKFNQQFGIPLKHCPSVEVKGYAEPIPAILVFLRKLMVENGGLSTEGIFRLAPEKAACAQVKTDINVGRAVNTKDVNILANLIKVWFRELPDKLLAAAPSSAIDHTARVGEAGAKEFITKMREPERSLLLWLLDTMADVVHAERHTRMNARNMAIVLSPNVYEPMDETPMAAMNRMTKVVQSMQHLLKWRIKNKRRPSALPR